MRAGGPDIHTVLHRPEVGMALLGLVKMLHPYAFYQVIAAAVVYVIANLILGIFDLQPKGTISTVQLIEAFRSFSSLFSRPSMRF